MACTSSTTCSQGCRTIPGQVLFSVVDVVRLVIGLVHTSLCEKFRNQGRQLLPLSKSICPVRSLERREIDPHRRTWYHQFSHFHVGRRSQPFSLPALFYPSCIPVLFSSPSWSKGGFTWIFILGIAKYNFLPASLNNLETALCLNIHWTPWAGIGTILTAAQTYSDSLLCFDQWTIINIRHRKNGEEYFYQKGRTWFNQCAVPVDWSQ